VDYIGRWLGGKFISRDYLDSDLAVEEAVAPAAGPAAASKLATATGVAKAAEPESAVRPRAAIDDAPSCSECGMLMMPNGSCYKCSNCGSTSGCS
jgi:ribonucleoside-diphosphate reductase alpha chain